MKLTWLGNAGVYLQDGDITILIDGIYGSNSFFNSRPSTVCIEAALGRGTAFRNADIVAFTHRHEDHFNSRHVNSYLCHNKVQKMYVPKASDSVMAYEDGGPVFTAVGQTRQYCLGAEAEPFLYDIFSPDKGIAFFRTRHMGAAVLDVVHYSIVVMSKGQAYFFMGDADWSYPAEKVRCMLGTAAVKAVCVNPLAYADRCRQKWLQTLGNPPVVLYHIPVAGDDMSGVRRLVRSGMSLQGIRKDYILQEAGQTIEL